MSISQGKKVKTAVVGCGMVSDIYIRNLIHLFTITDLIALCDIDRSAAEKKAEAYHVDRVLTLDQIAADPEIELVVNLTPPDAHYAVIRQMLEAGKHIYTEKMFTTDIAESRELVSLAEKNHLMIGAAPDTVLGAGIQTARKILDAGLAGRITSGFVSANRNQSLNSEILKFLQKPGGAMPYDVGIYYIGALIALLGSVKAVRGFGAPALYHEKELLFDTSNRAAWTISGNNLLAAVLEFECGTLVTVHFNGNSAGAERHAFELYGTEGIVTVGDPAAFGCEVKLFRPESEGVKIPFTHGYNGKNMLGEASPADGLGNRGVGVAELAWAIRRDRANRLSGEYALHCQEVLFGMDEAAATGKEYRVESRCNVRPLPSGYYSSMFGGYARGDAERSLIE